MIIKETGYSYNDLTVVPEVISDIESRSQCNPFVKDKLVRKTLVKSYIVFYKVAVNEIQVLRVLHSRSNYQTLLK